MVHPEGLSIKDLLLYVIILTVFGRICVLFQETLYKYTQGMTGKSRNSVAPAWAQLCN